ncbi:MAG TPA: endonuclease/exonuclease/phosphatase family protein [Mucilaginibacter sp.]|jgi:endonuclease/exonuclease/phosphatase family metal-dependent hydrolase|nr:endonuclease/exonuclease/phosphatase family protein [Mucilaginibacter sp.]
MKAKGKGLGFIDRLFLWINIFLCICILISYLAPVVNPTKFWPVAFFGLAYPYLLLGNVILVLYWLIRRKLWVFLSVICIVVGWKTLNRNIGLRFSTSPTYLSGSNMLRIMTYNVHNFKRYGSKNDISTKKDILQILKDEQPDVIGFQEFYTRNKGQYDMLDSIQRIMNTNNFYFMSVVSNRDEAIGMALFSKFPIVSRGMIQLASSRASENQCIYADIRKGDKTFRFYSVHLQSIRFDPEDYRYLNNVEPQQGKPEGSAMRLIAKLKNAFAKRSEQVFKIKEHATACPYPYLITGDFNDTPTSFAMNQMAKGLKNAFVEKGSGLGRTYNGSFPNYQIDYIMTSPQFDVVDYHIIEKRLSDHYPVKSDVVLK